MKIKNFIIVLSMIIIFFLSRYCLFFGGHIMHTFSSYLLYPVLRVQHAIIEPIRLWYCQHNDLYNIRVAHQTLQHECTLLRAAYIQQVSMMRYAQETQELSQFKARYNQKKSIIAQVLVRHLSDQNQFFLVDAGSSKGI